MTSSSPTVATTSDNHNAPDDRVVVDSSTAGRSNIRLATIAPRQPPMIWATMYRPVSRVLMRAVGPVDEGDDGVEVAAGDRPEDQDQPDQRAGGGGGVLEQLQADVARREPAGHDPGPDDGDDQQAGAERLGDQAPRQLDAGCRRCRSRAARPSSVMPHPQRWRCAGAARRRWRRTPSPCRPGRGRGSTSAASRAPGRAPRGPGRTP